MLSLSKIPISLYIHLPWCVKKCPYCDFYSSNGIKLSKDSYIDYLIKQAQSFIRVLQGRKLASIFIGGGTPNLFTLKQLDRLLNYIFHHYPLSQNVEVTIEANPGIRHDLFTHYPSIGINRISLGVQTFQPDLLKSLERIYDEKTLRRAIDTILKSNFNNFNIDLMFGLPRQSAKSSLYDIKQALQCEITHLSWYALTIEPGTPFAKRQIKLPTEETIEQMEQSGNLLIQQAGFNQYELSAFASNNHQCRHNLNYWQFGDYIGIGLSAHSKLTFSDTQCIQRLENHTRTDLFCKQFIKENKHFRITTS
jgi:putative oxygen-independent coproporphyrinogen III oxidase